LPRSSSDCATAVSANQIPAAMHSMRKTIMSLFPLRAKMLQYKAQKECGCSQAEENDHSENCVANKMPEKSDFLPMHI
jgi:hypothetical protein